MDLYVTSRKILKAIKEDDVKEFEILIQDGVYKTLRFGKFPLLSVCYLFKSNKIVSKYEKDFINIKTYNKVDEDIEIYKTFKKYSKRCIRIYLNPDAIVSPLEMLYIMGEKDTFNRAYAYAYKSDGSIKNLKKLHKIQTGEELEYKGETPVLPRKKMNTLIQTVLSVLIIISILGCFMSLSLAVYNATQKLGTEENPYIVKTGNQLIQAIQKKDVYIRVERDLVVNSIAEGYTFEGNIDGNGHEITLEGGNYLFYEMSGTVSNLIVNIATKESELVIDNSYFVLINSGVITNVKINAAISFKVSSSAPQSLYVSTCVAENRGTINNLIGNIKITLEGITTTNTTFGGLIALNSGTVNGLETTEDSYIEADTVDVGGLVAANNPEATVSNAINRADVTQISSNESWSPNVGGIIADNRGVLENSSNEGAIKGSSNIIQGETYTPQVIVGGLVAVNRGYIQKSSNKGVVIAESDKANIEIGGIVAENLAYVTGSYSTAQVKATVSYEESFVFIGGLIGHNQGLAANNYSLSQVLSEGVGEERLLQGELIGVCYVGSFQYISNCYYVKEDSVYLGIGGGGSTSLTGYTVYQLTEEQNGMFGVDLNILQDSGVYWQ